MPGAVGNQRHIDPSGNETYQNGHTNGNSTEHDGPTLSYNCSWCVKNREDYNPILRHVYDVKLSRTSDEIVVAEGFWPYSRLQIFDTSGKSIRKFKEEDILPFGIAFNKDKNIVITDHKDRTVKTYTPDGQHVNSWRDNYFEWPNGIAINNNEQYFIADWSKGKINICDESGTTVRSFNTFGNGISEYSCPEYLTIDRYNRIVMTDAYDHNVKIFDELGRLLLKFGDSEGPGKICDPRGVCTDNDGNIYVADWADSKIKMYSSSGSWICTPLSDENDLNHPWGIDIDMSRFVCTEHKRISGPTLKFYLRE